MTTDYPQTYSIKFLPYQYGVAFFWQLSRNSITWKYVRNVLDLSCTIDLQKACSEANRLANLQKILKTNGDNVGTCVDFKSNSGNGKQSPSNQSFD